MRLICQVLNEFLLLSSIRLNLSDKLTAVNQEMTLERQRLAAAEQQCALRVDEINSLHTRMQQTHEQHTNEVRVCVVVVVVVL